MDEGHSNLQGMVEEGDGQRSQPTNKREPLAPPTPATSTLAIDKVTLCVMEILFFNRAGKRTS